MQGAVGANSSSSLLSSVARPHHLPTLDTPLSKRLDEIRRTMGDGVTSSKVVFLKSFYGGITCRLSKHSLFPLLFSPLSFAYLIGFLSSFSFLLSLFPSYLFLPFFHPFIVSFLPSFFPSFFLSYLPTYLFSLFPSPSHSNQAAEVPWDLKGRPIKAKTPMSNPGKAHEGSK